MEASLADRLRRIQVRLGVEPDGIFGADTLTALEKKLSIQLTPTFNEATNRNQGIKLSRKGIDFIVEHEIGSKSYYERFLRSPTWPGGSSGVTIGFGYDLGYVSTERFRSDWQQYLNSSVLRALGNTCGLKKQAAKRRISKLKNITVSYDISKSVFMETLLPRYAQLTLSTYPAVKYLFPDAQAALVSLIYNRGTKLTGSNRTEMRQLVELVEQQDYVEIANTIRAMKRIWEGRNLNGLLRRRDAEANLVIESNRQYTDDEIYFV